MIESTTDAAVLWSGGKDCALAHYKAVLAGYRIKYLVTFAPPGAQFLAHPITVMQKQAEALELPHLIMEVTEPYEESYRANIQSLHDQHGIDTLVTGDIAEVDGCPNWIRQCCEGTGVSVFTPLWDKSREMILNELMESGFKIVFSCIKQPKLSPDWLGRVLDKTAFEDLKALNRENGVDPCGENGEYHTMTLYGPLFKKEIILASCRPVLQESMAHMDIDEIRMGEGKATTDFTD